MTLILSIPAEDGVVIASDSQVTSGQVRWEEKKIKRLNEHCLWSASGELALIQRVEEFIERMPNKSQPLGNIRDALSNVLKQAVTILLQQDFRTQFLPPQGSPDLLLTLHPGDFMFVEWQEEARILHLLSNGTTEWINKPFASGSGELFAYALLQKYQGHSYSLQKAALLAYKVLEESIEVGSWGLGFPIDIWQISKQGIKNLSEEEIVALADTSRLLRKAEIQSFLAEGKNYGKKE
jgi:20S proteasome alpha/beta subunit